MMRRQLYSYFILGALSVIGMFSCVNQEWEDHYNDSLPTVNMKLWEAIQDSDKYSIFLNYVEESGLDTLLKRDEGLTLFVPTNQAFEKFAEIGGDLYEVMAYHISQSVMISNNISGVRKLQMVSDKFATIEKNSRGIYFDGIKTTSNSALYQDGVLYELEQVAIPHLNLYEYAKTYSKVLSSYIDSRAINLLNKAESTAIGFNENGQTVYDSVYSKLNYFELEYFSQTDFKSLEVQNFEDFKKLVNTDPNLIYSIEDPLFSVYEEYRDKSTTLILFTQEQYDNALNEVARKLGSKFNDFRDIPFDWQQEVLIPYYFDNGLFDNSLDYSDLMMGRLKNVKSDSVDVDFRNIDPASRYDCSNGVVYAYDNLSVPDSLYNNTIMIEGEELVKLDGTSYIWQEGVEVNDVFISPTVSNAPSASGGSLLSVKFNQGYSNKFSLSFKFPKVFPRTYRLRYQANVSPSCLFEVYVNGIRIGSLDNGGANKQLDVSSRYNNFTKNIEDEFGIRHNINTAPKGFNNYDWRLEVDSYGDLEVTLVLVDGGVVDGPGKNGLVIDMMALIPYIE